MIVPPSLAVICEGLRSIGNAVTTDRLAPRAANVLANQADSRIPAIIAGAMLKMSGSSGGHRYTPRGAASRPRRP
jgi:hypothetical protein